jgi:recombination protein RecA
MTEKEDAVKAMSYKDMMKKFPDIRKTGEQLIEQPRVTIPVSPAFDLGNGDGVLEGSVSCFAGRSGCGKTTLALQIMGNAQQPEFDVVVNKITQPRKTVYIDAEDRLKKMNLQGIYNLDPKRVEVIQSTKNKQLAAEEILEILSHIFRDEEYYGAVVILDSVSALCPLNELVGEISGSIRSQGPKIMANFLRKNSGAILGNRIILITINHLITNTSGYGETLVIDGGVKLEFRSDIRLVAKGKPKKWESEGTLIGQTVQWDCLKASGTNSGNEIMSWFRYGHGIDSVQELITLAVDLAVIDKGGAWYSFTKTDGEVVKFQGQDKLYKYMMDPANLAEFELVKKKLKEIITYDEV